ncbi:MAG: tRNA uridine-5-carboxymethylaminomethyl(34) synthesis GTPase MnmE [Clostridia bacterium]|nr:tRNA uridine-5-carboxymethylaminomethyl(34) synthesis GTPase MnmE [Clostridia bacterium]
MYIDDTIAALATPLGEGGIGIVRISGPQAVDALEAIFRPKTEKRIRDFESHTLYLGNIISPRDGGVIDEALVAIMYAPRTFTREDVVEINCHGGSMPLRKTLEAVLAQGVRLAQPGEFTKRAFLNGRIDLVQAESILDIIRSRTHEGLRAAVDNLEGSISREIEGIRKQLSNILALVEVNIDFPEEDEEAAMGPGELEDELNKAAHEITRLLEGAGKGKILRDGIKVVIVGKPNVGKSSLLNTLLREKRAIVTDIPGTTRDIIEENLNLAGIPIRIIDTAGIRETGDEVEMIGVERSRKSLKNADLALIIFDITTGIQDEDGMIMDLVGDIPHLKLLNKIDLMDRAEELYDEEFIPISAKTGAGMDLLEKNIGKIIEMDNIIGDQPLINRIRHEQALQRALESIENAKKSSEVGHPLDIIAIDIKEAWSHLGEIVGDTVTEEILDIIFQEFCIGK